MALLALVAGGTSPLPAQAPGATLGFQGLRPAMSRTAIDSVLAGHRAQLRCQPTREPRLQACSAEATFAGGDRTTVTVHLVDNRVGIALIAARLPAERIADWHDELTRAYGDAPPERRPGQESFQWIRNGQMLRLTVRREAGGLVASVSLIDGPLLDGLPAP
ncbi:MAG: hypothetical protein KJZ47_11235 [Gemmatimonadales bacterium]|nr:hypothetical protein [Gemmatimonadales bacterium]